MDKEIYEIKIKNEINVDKVRICGEMFVENNRNKGSLILKNKKFPLNSLINIQDIKKNKIKMILNKNIYNKSYMFENCESILSISKTSFNDVIFDFQHSNNGIDNAENNNNDYDNKSFSSKTETEYPFYNNCKKSLILSEIWKEETENFDDLKILYMNDELK